ncbi:cyclin-J [Culex pipiens pallens]|uniref:cyclin-J n=1 Tax=Culex pipiens pallens TaxID=42434 RepID=UPI001954C037|nr:cyclin-J [Culex pipiens pallens]
MERYSNYISTQTEYSEDIIYILQDAELCRLTMRYTSPQLRYREVMVNFIRSVGEYEQLRRTTIHLAVYMLDAFMDNHNISDNRLNLVALTCVLLAAKIEENEPSVPSLSKLNELVQNQYPIADFTVLEVLLLKFFNWNLIIPTTATFVEFWLLYIVDSADFGGPLSEFQFHQRRTRAIELALEFLDITLTDIKMTNVRPSLLSAACVACARSCVPVLTVWNETMHEMTGFPWEEVESLTRELMDWRAMLITKETASRKRRPLDSGFMSDFDESFEEDEDGSDGVLSIDCDSDDSDDDGEMASYSKVKRTKY